MVFDGDPHIKFGRGEKSFAPSFIAFNFAISFLSKKIVLSDNFSLGESLLGELLLGELLLGELLLGELLLGELLLGELLLGELLLGEY